MVKQNATTTCKNLEYYVDEANKLISTIDGRKYYKYNTAGATDKEIYQ